MYLDQEWSGKRQNQDVVINSPLARRFGLTVTNDWDIYDGPDPSTAKIVARARGHHVQTSMDEEGDTCKHWFLSCIILFMPGSCYPGSTLAVKGLIDGNGNGEWAIVGGTGKFTLAQGAIYCDVVKHEGLRRIKELHIGVLYTPMERSTLRVMFSEFNPSEIDDAIDNGTHLGSGGYGDVYKAEIRNMTVAVKIHRFGSRQGEREFNQEVQILRKIRNENLVTLVGACSKRLALVYEFLPNGTLEDRFENGSFSWGERVCVAIGICSALEFLHNARPNPIAHGDLKPGNILFDAEQVCKLSDFGISRNLKYKADTATPGHTTDVGMGSLCYMDPEFIRTKRLTPQSDVHALGIILLQLATGQCLPVNLRARVEDENLSEQLVDSRMELNPMSRQDAVEMMRLGLNCSNDERKERPDLATAVRPVLESMRSRAYKAQEQPPSR